MKIIRNLLGHSEGVSVLQHEEMIRIQADEHSLIETKNLKSKEDYVLHLMHSFAYVTASRLAENKKVLDLGCNTGYGTEILFKSAKEVVGVDVSEKAILSAKSRYGHLGIEFQVVDGVVLPFRDNEFDMIVSFQVIEHIVDYGKYLNELKRVLSPSGIVLFATPNSLLRLDPGMKPWNKFHSREFNSTDLKSLLDTFFSTVGIFGLFAEDHFYTVEFNRVHRARTKARIKRMLPRFMLTGVRDLRNASEKIWKPRSPAPENDKEFLNQYRLEHLFYSSHTLDAALDLLAVCADDKDSFEKFQLEFNASTLTRN